MFRVRQIMIGIVFDFICTSEAKDTFSISNNLSNLRYTIHTYLIILYFVENLKVFFHFYEVLLSFVLVIS